MAGVFSTTIAFASGNAVTPAKLNQIATGSSFTADAIFGTTLAVTGGQLKVGTITSSEMGSASVGTTALAASAVKTAKIADGNVTTAKIGDSAVTAVKIADGVITAAKMAASAAATQTQMQNETGGAIVTPDYVKFSPGVAKAYGNVTIAGTSRTVSGEYNITSATKNSTTSTTVTIADNMANTAYTVMLTLYTDGTATDLNVAVTERLAGSFTIKHPKEGAPYEKIGFVVFGNLE